MSNPLTAGAIQKILLNPDNLPKNPVLQVLGLKKVQASQGSATERYRMVLSDGIHAHTCAMLATQLNSMVHNEELDIKAVVQLDKYICNTIQETRKVLIVLELTVIKRGSLVQERYGDPKVYGEQTDGQRNVTSNQNSRPSVQQNSGNFNRNQQSSSGSRFASNQTPASRNPNMPAVFPISSLNPYLNRWTICARVTSKSNIRTWSNSRGEGRLFSVDLIDESGEIRATCFTDLVDKFYDLLEPSKVYYISKGSLKAANKKYTSLKNDYELTFNSDTSIELCTDNDSLPSLQFNFCDIAKIQDVQPDHLTDVIGVCTSIAAVSEITVRSSGKQVSKREITLLDSTASVSCTLWGTEAENFEKYDGTNPIIAIKGVKVSDFGGRSLSLLPSSVMQVNPDDLQEAFKLRGWYDSVGNSENISSISGQRGEGINTNVYKMVRDIKEEGLGMSEKPDYFNITATVHYFRKENCLYKACPKAECNKKVVEDGDHYRCEKCNQSFPNFKHRLLLRANICDHTGDQWVTCFQDTAEALLSKTADEVGQLQEMDEKAFEQFFNEKTFQTVTLRVRAKMDKFNDEARIQCTADKVAPVDFRKESSRLMEEIDKMV